MFGFLSSSLFEVDGYLLDVALERERGLIGEVYG
jgi:hypothetical protein